MKYIAVLDTDDYEDFEFFEDGKEKYLHAVDAYAENGEWIYLPFKELEQEPFMATPCISSKVCEHDRMVTLDKIRAEIEELDYITFDGITKRRCLEIIDRYKAESEE